MFFPNLFVIRLSFSSLYLEHHNLFFAAFILPPHSLSLVVLLFSSMNVTFMRERFAVTPCILSWESDDGPEKGPLMLDVSISLYLSSSGWVSGCEWRVYIPPGSVQLQQELLHSCQYNISLDNQSFLFKSSAVDGCICFQPLCALTKQEKKSVYDTTIHIFIKQNDTCTIDICAWCIIEN